jgi:TonB family protein
MNSFAPFLLSFVLNSLWQIPLILLAAWLAARALRPLGPSAEHRAWVAALALESVLPALSIFPWQHLHLAWPWHTAAVADGEVAVAMGPGTAFSGLRFSPMLESLLAAAYIATVAFFALRFLWHSLSLSALSRSAAAVALSGDADLSWQRWRRRFASGDIKLASSDKVFAPVTMGIRKKLVLMPDGLIGRLSPSDFDTVLAHELAHVRRSDFLKNLLYEVMLLPVSYHPAVWLTRQRMMETREMVCDEMAADAGGREYAQSLLRLASLLLQGRAVRVPHAIGVFDSNTLERRLMKLTETKMKVGRARRVALSAACMVLGCATAASAFALRLAVDEPAANGNQESQKKLLSVPPAEMAGMIVSKVMPKYPPAAKKARIQGKVELHAMISKTGHVENVKVVSGPNELQASAMDAVRQWVYKPYLLNGNPVAVETTINVIYSLQK